MAKIDFETKCGCGGELKGSIKKPTRFEHRIVNVTCKACDSRYQLTCVRNLEVKDARVFDTFIDQIRIGRFAKEVISSRLDVKAKLAAAHVKNAIGIEPKVDNSVVQTSMDEVEV